MLALPATCLGLKCCTKTFTRMRGPPTGVATGVLESRFVFVAGACLSVGRDRTIVGGMVVVLGAFRELRCRSSACTVIYIFPLASLDVRVCFATRSRNFIHHTLTILCATIGRSDTERTPAWHPLPFEFQFGGEAFACSSYVPYRRLV